MEGGESDGAGGVRRSKMERIRGGRRRGASFGMTSVRREMDRGL